MFFLSRVIFSTARDGHIPGMFSGVHNMFKTPMPAVLLQVCLGELMSARHYMHVYIHACCVPIWTVSGYYTHKN